MIGAPKSPITYSEAEAIAERMPRAWHAITGQDAAPAQEQLTDLVQWIGRHIVEAVAAREGQDGEAQ